MGRCAGPVLRSKRSTLVPALHDPDRACRGFGRYQLARANHVGIHRRLFDGAIHNQSTQAPMLAVTASAWIVVNKAIPVISPISSFSKTLSISGDIRCYDHPADSGNIVRLLTNLRFAELFQEFGYAEDCIRACLEPRRSRGYRTRDGRRRWSYGKLGPDGRELAVV